MVGLVVLGVAGALGRALVERRLDQEDAGWPWGLFVVNVVGCGVLGAASAAASRVPDALLLAIGTGFCGAFTTFSGFAVAAVRIAQVDRRRAVAIVVAMIAAGQAAAAVGVALGGVS